MRRVYTDVREDMPESLAFAEHRGFQQTGRVDRMSSLGVRNARLDGFPDAEERVLQSGVRIATLEEIGLHEDVLHAVLSLENETARDIPASEERADRDFGEWKAAVLEAGDTSPACIWLALDEGRPVGVARLRRRGSRAMANGMTAVAASHRGRGIAKALKLQTVRWARENGIERIDTGNDVENYPMLAINQQLGYQPLPTEIEVRKELETPQPLT
jgi:RimJ/RimL family protein N-acetyltransferase